MKIDGSCHCGFISFKAEADPEKSAICHCSDCQSLSGTAFRTLIIVRKEDFTLLSGKPKTYVKTGDSGRKRAQVFCPECGSPLYATGVGAEEKFYNIRLGIVRQRAELPPKMEYWCRSSLLWLPEIAGTEKRERQ
ncbi:MAG: GFA family protein [Rhodospirillales bacterium]|nr:MAG: GFA family protein [Rhodospirillales bacterium]